jgi:protein-S-isoprenylcysteine O-methyltransferase Ste14
MYMPVTLIFNYNSPFAWYLGPILLVLGFFFLFITRFTARYYESWGSRYYLFSSIVRPVGALLIAWAWVEITATTPTTPELPQVVVGVGVIFVIIFMILMFLIFALTPPFWVALIFWFFILFFAASGRDAVMGLSAVKLSLSFWILLYLFYSLWSVFTLGLRRTFLFGKIDDPIVTSGPYQYQRHPQLFAAIALAFFTSFAIGDFGIYDIASCFWRMINLAIMIGLVALVTWFEEKDLEKRNATAYLEYKVKVPAFFGPSTLGSNKLSAITYLALASFIGSFLIFIFMPEYNNKAERRVSPFYYIIDHRNEHNWWFGTSGRDMEHLGYKLGRYVGDRPYPSELPKDILSDWQEWGRSIKHSPYPHTLFYCDKIYYLVADPDKPAYFEGHKLPVIRKLPFPLFCSKNKDSVEMALAFDYDNDGFPQVWFMRISSGESSGYIPPTPVMDDGKNTLSEEFFDPKTGKRIRIN